MNNTVNETVNNTFSNIRDSLIGGGVPPSWGGTVLYLGLFIFIPLGIMAIGIAILWNLASYTRFKKYLVSFGNSFRYALLGLISCVVLSLPMGLIYWGYMQAQTGNTVPLIYGGYIILGYIVLASIGWLVNKYVIERVQKFEKESGDTDEDGQE